RCPSQNAWVSVSRCVMITSVETTEAVWRIRLRPLRWSSWTAYNTQEHWIRVVLQLLLESKIKATAHTGSCLKGGFRKSDYVRFGRFPKE
ncbi:hypothetical protein, partial [Salicola sp. Rm-C-2C1-2]|uniref:hypothetical protein n=1 Tax=Salicola sp. Rm-C-2C1-2 TaxID=3141321 RepID=UPI0032E3F0D7